MAKAEFYTYVHRRADSGEVFYVGKGKGKRAYERSTRNQFWKNIANKHGRVVEIVAFFYTDADALWHECELIAEFKASNAVLANLTDGGEGISGYVFSDERREARKAYLARPEIKEKHRINTQKAMQAPGLKDRIDAARRASLDAPGIKEKHSAALSVAMRGKKHSVEHRQAIAAAWDKPGARKSQSEKILKSFTPEVKAKHKEAVTAALLRPEVRSAFLDAMNCPEHRAKMSAANIAAMARPEVKDRHRKATAEAMNRLDVRARLLSAMARPDVKNKQIAAWSDPQKKALRIEAMRAGMNDPVAKERKREAMRQWWAKRKQALEVTA